MRVSGAANLFALCEDLRATGVVNCSIDTASAEQRRVGGVHDRSDILLSEVSHYDENTSCQKRFITHCVAQS